MVAYCRRDRALMVCMLHIYILSDVHGENYDCIKQRQFNRLQVLQRKRNRENYISYTLIPRRNEHDIYVTIIIL